MQLEMVLPYPDRAGHRGDDCSIEAADGVEARRGRKLKCYEMILDCLGHLPGRGMTSYEFCEYQRDFKHNYAQPRFSELFALGKIKKSGERRPNPDGNNSNVWILA